MLRKSGARQLLHFLILEHGVYTPCSGIRKSANKKISARETLRKSGAQSDFAKKILGTSICISTGGTHHAYQDYPYSTV